jgi:hypothetical protein
MTCLRFRRNVVIFGVIGAVLVFLLSSFVVRPPTAHASANSCSFALASTVIFQVDGGGWPGVFQQGSSITVSKFTDGCGNEYGAIFFENTQTAYFGSFVLIVIANQSGGPSTTSTEVYENSISTPIFSGNIQICGSLEFNLAGGGGGGAGGCTAS